MVDEPAVDFLTPGRKKEGGKAFPRKKKGERQKKKKGERPPKKKGEIPEKKKGENPRMGSGNQAKT